MYVVIAKGSTSYQSLENVRGAQEMTSTIDGERVFVVKRDLKKD